MNDSKLSKVNHEKDLVTTSNQINIVQTLLRKLTNWSASSDELLSINLKKLSAYYIMHSYALILNIAFNSGHHNIKKIK